MVVRIEPDNVSELSPFRRSFSLPYDGCGLPTAVVQMMELHLKLRRLGFSEKQRMVQFKSQGDRCALCDGELRAG